MDWNLAIERNREALKRILAMLVAMAGLGRQSAIASRQSEPAQAADGPTDCLLPTADCRSPCRAISTARSCACCARPNPPPGGSSSSRRAASS